MTPDHTPIAFVYDIPVGEARDVVVQSRIDVSGGFRVFQDVSFERRILQAVDLTLSSYVDLGSRRVWTSSNMIGARRTGRMITDLLQTARREAAEIGVAEAVVGLSLEIGDRLYDVIERTSSFRKDPETCLAPVPRSWTIDGIVPICEGGATWTIDLDRTTGEDETTELFQRVLPRFLDAEAIEELASALSSVATIPARKTVSSDA